MIEIYLARGKYHAEAMTEKVFSNIHGKPAPSVMRDAFGKPVFADDSSRHLSLSHSGDYTILALADCPVGVDLQRLRMKTDPLAAAKRFFTPAEAEIIEKAPPDQRTRCFLDIWAKKEAAVKAAGTGFDIPPSSFSVLSDQLTLKGLTLRFIAIDAPAGYTARLAASADNPSVEVSTIIG